MVLGVAIISILAALLATQSFVSQESKSALKPVSDATVSSGSGPVSTPRLTDDEIRVQNDVALAKLHANQSPAAVQAPTPQPTSSPKEYLSTEAWSGSDFKVAKTVWEKGGFNSVAIWHITIKNLTNRPIGNFLYTTDYASETGINHGSRAGVLEKRIEPGETKTFEINDGFIYSQADRASIDFTKAEFLGGPESKSRKRN